MFAGNFPPLGWAFCDGSLLPIAENETLFSLIGTTYGGDGQQTFALPDLRGRSPMHAPATLGQALGSERVSLLGSQIPSHTHALQAVTDPATEQNPRGAFFAATERPIYTPSGTGTVSTAPSMVAPTGEGQPHDNMQPFACVSFIISLFGIYPSPS